MSRSSNPKEPKMFFPLVAISVVLVLLGIIEITSITSAKAVITTNYRNPTLTGHDLFDASKFRLLRRAVRAPVSSASSASSSSAVSSSAASSSVSSESVHSAALELKLEDLTSTQRETLRRQLRVYACPTDVDPAYTALCEKMLKAQGHLKILQGPKNPNQK